MTDTDYSLSSVATLMFDPGDIDLSTYTIHNTERLAKSLSSYHLIFSDDDVVYYYWKVVLLMLVQTD